MPLFGFRKDKKHEQSHIQAAAGLAKTAVPALKKSNAKPSKNAGKIIPSDKPEKISAAVMTKDAGAAKSAPALPAGAFTGATEAIIRPYITEKSSLLSQSGVYTFQVTKGANKQTVAKAIAELYKVAPVKVAMTNLPSKTIIHRGRKGTVPGIKKALVTVKKGDKIDFV
jgi:large subunit ribosomal protein L23